MYRKNIFTIYHGATQMFPFPLTPSSDGDNPSSQAFVSASSHYVYALVHSVRLTGLVHEEVDPRTGRYILQELRPNAFKFLFDREAWMYVIDPSENFFSINPSNSRELISYDPVQYKCIFYVTNILNELRNRNKEVTLISLT